MKKMILLTSLMVALIALIGLGACDADHFFESPKDEDIVHSIDNPDAYLKYLNPNFCAEEWQKTCDTNSTTSGMYIVVSAPKCKVEGYCKYQDPKPFKPSWP